MAKALKIMLLVHAVLGAILGVPLLLAPGRLLSLLGWAPIDPILSRILGAALLAFAWTHFRAWQAEVVESKAVLEMEVVFTGLSCVGLLRHLLFARYPLVVWILFAILALLLAASVVFLLAGVASKPKR